MIKINNIKNNKGFSLIELVLAIAVFSLSSVAMVTMLVDSSISTRLSAERTEALFYAKEGVGAVRSIRDNSWGNLVDGSHGLDSSSGAWVLVADTPDLINNKYTRTVTISTISTSTKNIAINVAWELTTARIASTTLNTILTNWGAVN